MRNLNEVVFPAANATITQTSSAIDTGQIYSASLVVNFSANNSGTIKLQGSNDPTDYGNLTAPTSGAPVFVPTNWVDIPTASATPAAATTAVLEKTQLCYRWIRVVWTPSGGSGTITACLNTQGF